MFLTIVYAEFAPLAAPAPVVGYSRDTAVSLVDTFYCSKDIFRVYPDRPQEQISILTTYLVDYQSYMWFLFSGLHTM